MVDKNYTHISIILDRSGSMNSIATDMVGGLESFLTEQKKNPGRCTVSLIQFDDKYETVFNNVDIKEVPQITLQPRGSTALLDASNRAILDLGTYLSSLPEEKRPGNVIVCIITDGQENCSREITKEALRQKIEHQTNVYKWSFIYIGSDASTFDEARSFGLTDDKALLYNKTKGGVKTAYDALNANVTRSRSANAPVSFSKQEKDQVAKTT